VQTAAASIPAYVSWGWEGWGTAGNLPPSTFYALWKYAQLFPADAASVYNASKNLLAAPPSDAILIKYPFANNAYIAGYLGYLNLQTAAGVTQTPSYQTKLTQLKSLRSTNFSKDTPYASEAFYTAAYKCRSLSVARNFMDLVPEVGTYLHDNATALSRVQTAMTEYQKIAPYWFVSAFEDTTSEAIIQPLYDYNALFQAKALILKEPASELVKYLDVPAFQRGDLFYIQNLTAVLEAR
jgi:hypothetical protein